MGFRFDFSNQPEFYGFMEDFETYTAADWVITTVEAGAGSATEAVDADAPGGILVVTNDAADNDADNFQRSADGGTTPSENFAFTSGKKLYAGIRLKLDDTLQSEFIFGFVITDTTPLAHTDGIVIQKDDGDANLDGHVTKDSTASDAAAMSTLTDDTYAVLEIYYDGGDTIAFFKDGVGIGSLPVTNAPDDENLALTFGVTNGEAVAKVMSIDWIAAYQERS